MSVQLAKLTINIIIQCSKKNVSLAG